MHRLLQPHRIELLVGQSRTFFGDVLGGSDDRCQAGRRRRPELAEHPFGRIDAQNGVARLELLGDFPGEQARTRADVGDPVRGAEPQCLNDPAGHPGNVVRTVDPVLVVLGRQLLVVPMHIAPVHDPPRVSPVVPYRAQDTLSRVLDRQQAVTGRWLAVVQCPCRGLYSTGRSPTGSTLAARHEGGQSSEGRALRTVRLHRRSRVRLPAQRVCAEGPSGIRTQTGMAALPRGHDPDLTHAVRAPARRVHTRDRGVRDRPPLGLDP